MANGRGFGGCAGGAASDVLLHIFPGAGPVELSSDCPGGFFHAWVVRCGAVVELLDDVPSEGSWDDDVSDFWRGCEVDNAVLHCKLIPDVRLDWPSWFPGVDVSLPLLESSLPFVGVVT